MTALARWGLCLALWLFMLTAQAQLQPIPALQQRVTDNTATLTATQIAELDQKLRNLETDKGSQLVVLIVASTQPETIEQFSIRVVEQWKIGREGVDDGVLLLIAKQDRQMRVEVGYGLEGAIPDIYAKRIIAETITPHFKQDDFYGGIAAGVDSLIGLISGETLPEPTTTNTTITIQNDQDYRVYLGAWFFGSILLSKLFKRFWGALLSSALAACLAWLLFSALNIIAIMAAVAFVFSLILPELLSGLGGGYSGGSSGDWNSSSGNNDSFSGGGGDFGGGGASGDW